MSTFAEYTKKKKKDMENMSFKDYTSSVLGISFPDIAPIGKDKDEKEEDIAPVRGEHSGGSRRESGTTTISENTAEERTWFQKGEFEDGYQFGDLTKTILGSKTDLATNVSAGIIGMGEKAVDVLAYLAPAFSASQQAQNNPYYQFDIKEYKQQQKDMSEFIQKDLYDEQEIAKSIISDPYKKVTGIDSETASVFGAKSDSLAQSAGQLGATIGLQAVGVPWWLTTGATSFGGEAETALKEGATYEQAGGSALITAGADILTEKISGGIKFGGKTLDDGLTKVLARKISDKTLRTFTKLGVDATGEGFEEVLAGAISNLGTSLYKEENLEELLFSEEAMDEYIESFIGGAVLGGGMGGINAVRSNSKGVDYVTEMTENEQKVHDAEVKRRTEEAEAEKGEKLTGKEKKSIYEQVTEDLERGHIDTSNIESVLGGETYETYNSIVEQEKAINEEIKALENKVESTFTHKDSERLAELREQLKTIDKQSVQERLSAEVEEMTRTDRLHESYNERSRRGQAFEADLTQYAEGVQRDTVKSAVESGILNNTNRTHEFVDLVAKLSADKGVLFDFTDNAKLKETGFALEGRTVNGYVQDGKIAVNINSSKALNTVVGHEITHVLEGTELYSQLQQAVTQYAKTKGEYDSRLEAITKLYKGVENANIDNELTADLVGEYLFTDKDFINNLSTEQPSLFKKIFDEVKYLAKVATAGSKEARELAKAKRVFEQAYKETSKAKVDGTILSLSENQIDNNSQMAYNNSTENGINSTIGGAVDARSNGTEQSGTRTTKLAERRNEVRIEDGAGTQGRRADSTADRRLSKEFYVVQETERQKLNSMNVTDNEFWDSSSNPELFSFALETGKTSSPNGVMVDGHTAEELRESGAKTFLAKDNMAGGAVMPDGNIVAVFKNSTSSSKKAGVDIILTALENGGTKLDCYGSALLKLYSNLGFEPVAKVKFNTEYAPDGWNFDKFGLPDIYVMKHNGKTVAEVVEDYVNDTARRYTAEEIADLPYMEYDDAMAYRDSLIEEGPQYSLSNNSQDIAPTGNYRVYGSDVALEAPMQETQVAETEVTDDYAPLTEEMANERDAQQGDRLYSLDDADALQEVEEAPYLESEPVKPEDPFAERDIQDVGKKNVKAYMYENPEVRPYFQEEAKIMLRELSDSIKGEKHFNDQLYYDTNGELGWFGTKRETSEQIAYLLDRFKYTYADIRKGLEAIIEDHGAENIAVAKRLEFMIDERLRDGYTDFLSGYDIPANEEYLTLMKEKQISDYSDEAFEMWARSLSDEHAPVETAPTENIAPVREDIITTDERQQVMDFEKGEIVDEEETEARKTHAEIQKAYVDAIKAKFAKAGFDFDAVLEKAKDKSTFASVDNTPQRFIEKTLGYKEGQILSDMTIEQEALNESAGIKWLNSFTSRKDGKLAQLSKKYGIKPNSKADASAQMYGEGFYVNEAGEYITYGDAELAKDFPDVEMQKKIKALAKDPLVRQIYDETLDQINASRVRNGYPEIPRRKDYFLHFRAMDDTFSRLGIPFNPNDIKAKDLPTDINGMTADLKPGQPYFASAMQRRGNKTSYSLLGGMERYLTSAKNQIYHIDDIQTLRGLRNYVADMYGQAHGLEGLNELTEEEAEARIKEVYDSHLSNFAKFLNEQANTLAGKTSLIDRGLEGVIGRRGISTLNTINTQVAKNMVGFNVSSSLTNFVGAVQGLAKVNKFDAIKAFSQVAYNKLTGIFGKTDGFAENDPGIIRRKGAEKFYRTPWEKVSDKGYILMSAVDDVTSEFLIRAKYNELTRNGMDSEKAHIEADKWAMRILGDRSLGQQPQLYNSKMLGLVTKFQLEVRNQLDSMFYDTIQEANVSTEDIQNASARNAKKSAKIASTMVQLAVFQHLFGKGFEAVAGYNPTFDIISVLMTLVGYDDDEESEDTFLDNTEQAFLELLGDLPYTSTLTGGRVPIQSALPITELIKGEDSYGNEKSRWETLAETAPYYLMPGGYNQIKKTTAGLKMFDEELPVAGSYTDSGNLRFPIEDTPLNRIQAGVFGQWANKNARDYFDNERQPLKEKQIEEFAELDLPIADYWKYREGLAEQKTLEDKFDYIAGLDLPVEKKNIMINNVVDRKEEVDLANYDDFENYEEFDFAVKNPEKYPVVKAVGGFDSYKKYTKALADITADKDENGKTISGSRKEKVTNYINGLNAEYGAKIILFKSEYPADNTYNQDIVDYLNERSDITYSDMASILKELGFTVEADGTVRW